MTGTRGRPEAAPRSAGGRPADGFVRGAFPVGRLGGVPVAVHWSVLVIVGLIAWALAGQVFPDAYPDDPAWAHVVAGVAAAVVFLLGLLAHELSHAVVARRSGVRVQGITLWLFGGVAQLGGEAPDARADLRIAGVGPLVSLLLGGVFAVLAALADAAGLPGPAVGALAWLAGINVLLAVFNVLPGAPLDGGRLLRAALWMWRGDRVWAAVTAARAGRVLGVVLVALGLAEFLVTGTFAGVWLALIGWFVMGAAAAEEQQARLGDLLADVRVRDAMTPEPDVAPADLPVAEFVERYLLTRRHASFPIVEDGRPVGLVTLGRIRELPPDRRETTTLREVAWPVADLPLVGRDDPLPDVVARLGPAGDGRALVVDGGVLVGILTPTDISRTLQQAALRRPRAGIPTQREGGTT